MIIEKNSNFGDNMNIQELLDKCEDAYFAHDYKRLIELCDEVFKIDPDSQNAIGYKSIAYCFLNQPEKALEILEKGIKLYPDNYYINNHLAMVYYDLGDYEKSLKYCEQGLKIKDFDWLFENKIKALLKLGRIDKAIECYENAPADIEICDLLIEAEKYDEALKYCLNEDIDDFELVIDKIKEANTQGLGEYYILWIDKIKFKYDTEVCPDCGGPLLPIIWGYPNPKLLEKAERGEVFLGGCDIPLFYTNYHCKKCNNEFYLGCEGLHIECEDYKLNEYIKYKIRELTRILKNNSTIFVRSLDALKKELRGFDDKEFDAFINHLKYLDYIDQPREGYIKLVGFKDLKCAKEYLDEGKFAAPEWLVYPQLSAWTIGWRMGAGEHYVMNLPHHDEEFRKLFPMPKYWNFRFSESPYKPHPLLGYFWREDGKPEYPNISDGIEINDFINLNDEKEFTSDTFRFKSIEQALLLSKCLHFKKCDKKDDFDVLDAVEFTLEEEKNWDIYKYSVLLNASYFKIMEDGDLKQKLLETGDEPLIYVSDDEENLFGRALMELRDEIRRLCKNEDLIDWEYTEYLKYKPWY
ncbi:hypothetical protein TL18_01765 [Methanobrevibacter sp. YE315]|nr:hypothetical protein TL18_01765 [Methanobrevibacter sp. YE315]